MSLKGDIGSAPSRTCACDLVPLPLSRMQLGSWGWVFFAATLSWYSPAALTARLARRQLVEA